jgi:hypothetical protein
VKRVGRASMSRMSRESRLCGGKSCSGICERLRVEKIVGWWFCRCVRDRDRMLSGGSRRRWWRTWWALGCVLLKWVRGRICCDMRVMYFAWTYCYRIIRQSCCCVVWWRIGKPCGVYFAFDAKTCDRALAITNQYHCRII